MDVRPEIAALKGYVPGEQPQGGDWVKLNTNENPYPCSPSVQRAIGTAIKIGLHKYPDPLATTFREAASQVLDLPSDWILCGNGSDDILTIVTRAFVGTGDLLRLPDPSYILYRTLAELQGARYEEVPFTADWKLDQRFTAPADGLKIAFLPNPNSPSGTILTPSEILELADRLPCPLLVDEAYADFATDNCLRLIRENPKIMVSRTLSKSYALAGLRFGFLAAHPTIIEQLLKVKDSYNCNALSIAGATAAMLDQHWLTDNRNKILAERASLAAKLRELKFDVLDSQANFLWCTHPQHSAKILYEDLKARRILVRYMNYPNWSDGLRITIGTPEQSASLLRALHEIFQL